MKKNPTPARAGFLVSIPGLLLLALYPVTGVAFEFPPPGSGLCFSFGSTPYFADVITGVPGKELIVTDITETVLADTDSDGFSVVSTVATVKIFDRSGTVQWRSAKLKLNSPDLATVIPGGGFGPDTYFFPGIFSNSFATTFFLGGFTCYDTVFAVEAGGQKYIAVILGFLAQTGTDEASGVDKSRLNIWILNRDTGAIVHLHKLRPVASKFLSGVFLSGIGEVDGDTDDELVVARTIPRGGGEYKLVYQTYNILNGTLEDKFNLITKNRRVFK